MYEIYKITSPSGKSYIGLTKTGIRERWRKHVRRALIEQKNHPFYCAIRKYGPEAFMLEVLEAVQTKGQAQKAEMQHIAAHDKKLLYNLSRGGEADGEEGGRLFWASLNTDSEKKEAYLKKLSERKKTNDWSAYDKLAADAAKWREEHPREAYKLSARALRIAKRSRKPSPPKKDFTKEERLRWKYARSAATKKAVTEVWEKRPESERARIRAKISATQKERWTNITDPTERSGKTITARSAIDRNKQGPAASKGLKAFWEELRKDPERYREYMDRRTRSLMKTLEGKHNEDV